MTDQPYSPGRYRMTAPGRQGKPWRLRHRPPKALPWKEHVRSSTRLKDMFERLNLTADMTSAVSYLPHGTSHT